MRKFISLLFLTIFVQLPLSAAVWAQENAPATPVPQIDVCGDYSEPATPEPQAATENADATFDLAYVDSMITSHQNAIIMLLIAEPRVEHSELKAFVQNSLTARRATIEVLLAWRSDHHPDAPWVSTDQAMVIFDQTASENPGRGGIAGAREIAANPHIEELCTATEQPFDLMLIDHLIPWTSGTMLLSEGAMTRVDDESLSATARDLAVTFQREIDALYAWRQLLFPEAGEPHAH